MENSKIESRYERNELRAEDIKFIRSFLRSMDQTRVLRWRNEWEPSFVDTHEVAHMRESDAEHTGMMNSLSTYILYKAAEEEDSVTLQLNLLRVNAMINLHDMPENLVGDSRDKDEDFHNKEAAAVEGVKDELKTLNFGKHLADDLDEYEAKISSEARFVKAIDELQAALYMVYTKQFHETKRDYSKPEDIKGLVYAEEFPTLDRICKLVSWTMNHPKILSGEVPHLPLIEEQYR